MNFTPQQIKERYKTLPQDLRDVYFSEETAEKLAVIGKANNLRTDQIGLLADETGLVMLGLTSTSEYIPNLAKRLGIDKELAKKVAEEVNSQIFSQMREAMQKIHGAQDRPASPKQGEPQNKIYEEKTKDEGHRSGIETIEKIITPAVPLNLPIAAAPRREEIKKEPAKAAIPPKYPAGIDPYREPIN